jgi:hypothetical protein
MRVISFELLRISDLLTRKFLMPDHFQNADCHVPIIAFMMTVLTFFNHIAVILMCPAKSMFCKLNPQ